jgi:BirA family biotin operon repressor/biotin-[acetyl-CoA-carboxylase] ligase
MDVCREMLGDDSHELRVVVADEQTQGRGRQGRSWYSPPGDALYLSLLARPHIPVTELSRLTMLGALAVCDMLQTHFPELAGRCGVKWFNDVMLDDRKLAGILVESALQGDLIEHAILGIGLNINTDFSAAPVEVQRRATSLAQGVGRKLDTEVILHAVLGKLQQRYIQLTQDTDAVFTAYRDVLETLGRHVRVEQNGTWIEGEAVELAPDGALVVRTTQGVSRIAFGDIT